MTLITSSNFFLDLSLHFFDFLVAQVLTIMKTRSQTVF